MVLFGGLELVAVGYVAHKYHKHKKEKERLEDEKWAADELAAEEAERQRRRRQHDEKRHKHDRRRDNYPPTGYINQNNPYGYSSVARPSTGYGPCPSHIAPMQSTPNLHNNNNGMPPRDSRRPYYTAPTQSCVDLSANGGRRQQTYPPITRRPVAKPAYQNILSDESRTSQPAPPPLYSPASSNSQQHAQYNSGLPTEEDLETAEEGRLGTHMEVVRPVYNPNDPEMNGMEVASPHVHFLDGSRPGEGQPEEPPPPYRP